MEIPERFWERPPDEVMRLLGAAPSGLSGEEARRRLREFGPNVWRRKKGLSWMYTLLGQFKSPVILILIFAAVISSTAGDIIDASIIMAIIAVSGLLGFIQEYGAGRASERLLGVVKTKAVAVRGGAEREVNTEDVVPGDIVLFSAGSMIPADCLVMEAKDFSVNESALTGETFPAEKAAVAAPSGGRAPERRNAVFMGTSAVSGTARAVAVRTGASTEFGRIAGRLLSRAPETGFERGIRRFGYFLMEVTLVLILVVFAINVYFRHPVIETLMFSLALAVGLTPQLLPAIITVNLARGSQYMSRQGVIVKRLSSIENFGTMDILCTDKTGTLTEGSVVLEGCVGPEGEKSLRALLFARLNAVFQTGLKNPMDDAVREAAGSDISGYFRVDELPYDFERKRMSVVLCKDGEEGCVIVTKGALKGILRVSSFMEGTDGEGAEPLSAERIAGIEALHEDLSSRGLRVLGVAYKRTGKKGEYAKEDESGMTFLGLLLFSDPPKKDAKKVLGELEALGVGVKIITGDTRQAAARVAEDVGFGASGVLTGAEIHGMTDWELMSRVEGAGIFAEVDPGQKERIILALKRLGHVVGFMGDGINDAPALHASDVGISVNTGADVAKDAADIVLLESGLEALRDGVVEGRKTFANTLKYVFMATSANFGNMFSVAGASLFLPFLPMLPKQILLTNLLTDFPEMTISTDSVDAALVETPRRWDIGFIKRFMVFFGLLSSVFDYVTFGVLLFALGAGPDLFRTGWFLESVLSASFAVMALRTRMPFYRSRPGRYLLLSTLATGVFTLFLPYTPFAGLLGFLPLPPEFFGAIALILLLYIFLIEAGKKVFYGRLEQNASLNRSR